MDRRAGCAGRRRRRPRRPRAGFGRRHRCASRRASRRGRAVRGPAARRHRGPVGRAGAPRCGCPTISAWPAIWPPAWRRCTWWTRACGWTWPRWPTNWTPRRFATAPDASCSPIRPRRWPNGCRAATSCWPATTRRRWRWPATARRSCCGSRTRRSPRWDWPTRWWRCAAGWAAASAPIVRQSIFHDEQIDGPLPPRVRTFVLATDAERPVVLARVSGLDDVDVINAEDVPEALDVQMVRAHRWPPRRPPTDVRNNNWRCWPSGWR